MPDVNAATLKEQGIDVVFENWRSVAAPPGLDAAGRRRLAAAVDAMVHSAEWHDQLTRYRWLDRYLAGDQFAQFVDGEEGRVRDILRAFGQGGAESGSLSSAATGGNATQAADTSGLVVTAGGAG